MLQEPSQPVPITALIVLNLTLLKVVQFFQVPVSSAISTVAVFSLCTVGLVSTDS